MSCVLRITASGLEHHLASLRLQPYRLERGTGHFTVSKCEFDDLPGQVVDAIDFLARHQDDLRQMLASEGAYGALDFAVAVRDGGFSTKRFPAGLIQAAAAAGLSIDLSVYPGEGHAA
jgi:hypothetical protein